jgi:hypothetical protein
MYVELVGNDQLTVERRLGHVFPGFYEPPLTFRPTYKLDVGTSGTYDTSKKKRIPSWTDRILVRTKQMPSLAPGGGGAEGDLASEELLVETGTEPLLYNAHFAVKHSDHAPVTATFGMGVEVESADVGGNIHHAETDHAHSGTTSQVCVIC